MKREERMEREEKSHKFEWVIGYCIYETAVQLVGCDLMWKVEDPWSF